MKKNLLITLVMILCLGLCLGCGNKKKENSNKENKDNQNVENKVEDNSKKYDWNWDMEIIEDGEEYLVWQVSFYQTDKANDEYPKIEVKREGTVLELESYWENYAEIDGKKAINYFVRTEKGGKDISKFEFIAKHSTFESPIVPTTTKNHLYQYANYSNPQNIKYLVPIGNKWYVTDIGNGTGTNGNVWSKRIQLILLVGDKNTKTTLTTNNIKFYSKEKETLENIPSTFQFKDVLTTSKINTRNGYEYLTVELQFTRDENPFSEWEAMKNWVNNHNYYYVNENGNYYLMF